MNIIIQMVMVKLLNKWDIDGFLQHCKKVTSFYRNQRDMCVEAVNKHLSGKLNAWLRQIWDMTPLYGKSPVQKIQHIETHQNYFEVQMYTSLIYV